MSAGDPEPTILEYRPRIPWRLPVIGWDVVLVAGIVMIGFVLPGMQRTSNTYHAIYLRILTLGEWMIVSRALIGTIRRDRSWGWTVWLLLVIGLPEILGRVSDFGRRSPQGDALSRELLRWTRPIVDWLWPWLT